MKGTTVYIEQLLSKNRGWMFGVKAYDDFDRKVVESPYGRSIKGIVHVVISTCETKKYHEVLVQLIPQLRKEYYLHDIILSALKPLSDCQWNTTVSELMNILKPFNLSQTLVENHLRGLVEEGQIRNVELQADLENIYV